MNGSYAYEVMFAEQQRQKQISDAKLKANRANAQKSTGPKTAKGKAVSSRNAVTHGLLANAAFMDRESRRKFNAFRDGLVRALKPIGEVEQVLAERVVSGAWRLRRILKIESELMEQDSDGGVMQWILCNAQPKKLGAIFRSYSGSRDTLCKLSRYEGNIDRGMYRALHELQRLQAARAGKDVPAPVAVDVDVAVRQEAQAAPSPAHTPVDVKPVVREIARDFSEL